MPKANEALKIEVIEYSKSHTIDETVKAFSDRTWPDSIKRWCDPEFCKRVNERAKLEHQRRKGDPAYQEMRNRSMNKPEVRQNRLDYFKKFQEENKETCSAIAKQHRTDNLEHYKRLASENYFDNKPARNAKAREWYQKNKAHCHAIELNRYHTDPITKLKAAIRVGLGRALKYANVDKEHPSIIYLGCSIDDFKVHIENQFKVGMSWDNHGDWHLDHRKPLSLLSDTEDVELLKELCYYKNYQPLWKEENLSKYVKVTTEQG